MSTGAVAIGSRPSEAVVEHDLAINDRSAATADDVGVVGPSYGTNVSAPTGQKPESKLWFQDGSWWGILSSDVSPRGFAIHRFDWDTDTWIKSAAMVDTRTSSDALWSSRDQRLCGRLGSGVATRVIGCDVATSAVLPASAGAACHHGGCAVVVAWSDDRSGRAGAALCEVIAASRVIHPPAGSSSSRSP